MSAPLLAPAVRGAPADNAGRWRRGWTVLVLVTTVVLLHPPATAQEPPILSGTWGGTWWMGKYEAPIELDLTQARGTLAGHVRLWGYPGVTSEGPVRAPITGTFEGHRVQLSWMIPEQGRLSVDLTLLSPDWLFGLGGVAAVTAGFELHRSR